MQLKSRAQSASGDLHGLVTAVSPLHLEVGPDLAWGGSNPLDPSHPMGQSHVYVHA